MEIECPICKDPIDTEFQVASTPCGHIFHSNCIETWIGQGNENCPQCREVCRRQNIRPIFLPFSDQENPSAGWYQNELLPRIQNQDTKKLVCYGIGMFLLAGKLARILNDFFNYFSKFCFLLSGTAALIQRYQAQIQRYQALIHEKNAIIQRDQARIQRLSAVIQRLLALIQRSFGLIQEYQA